MTQPREDDTALDALSAQARAFPPLPMEEVALLLEDARDHPKGSAEARLIEHHLSVALEAALAHRGKGLEIADLYQEGTFAVMVAISEYAGRRGLAGGLRAYVERVTNAHLDSALADEKAARETEAAMVRSAELLGLVEVRLRVEFGREPTEADLAAALEWPVSQVLTVRTMLRAAREISDDEIVDYLDDDEVEPD